MPNGYGVTQEGFEVKRLTDVENLIYGNIKTLIHPNANLAPGSVFNMLTTPFAFIAHEMWETLQELYSSFNLNDATGIQLDNLAFISAGISRLKPGPSRVYGSISGDVGTELSTDFRIRMEDNNIMQLMDPVILKNGDIADSFIEVVIVDDGQQTLYEIEINGVTITYTYGGNDPEAITNLWIQRINDDVPNVKASVVPSSTALVYIEGEGQNIVSINNIENTQYYNNAWFQNIEDGYHNILPFFVQNVETPVSGIAVQNFVDGLPGRDVESDPELLQRVKTSYQKKGAANAEAMKATILDEIDGVYNVSFNEYDGTGPNPEGLPDHSVEFIIEGGDDQEIAELLWQIKGGGIQLYGNVELTVVDSQGRTQTVKFSRPTRLYGYLEITYFLDDEKTTDDNFEQQIINNCYDFARDYQLSGIDLYYQKYIGPCQAVNGIKGVAIRVAAETTEAAAPQWTTDKEIASREIAVIDKDRIQLIEG